MNAKKSIAIFCLLIIACSSERNMYNFKSIKMKVNQLNSETKTIDVELLNKYINDYNSKTADFFNNKVEVSSVSSGEYFYKSHNGYILDQYNTDNDKIKEVEMAFDSSLIEVTEKIDDYFNIYETYFGNGKMKSKLISSKLGFVIGKQYYYNKEGELIETIDTDQGYKFNYEDVLEFCVKKNISFDTITFPLRISKVKRRDGKRTWVIEYPNNEIQKIEIYVLDAESGNTLLEKEELWPVFKHISPKG